MGERYRRVQRTNGAGKAAGKARGLTGVGWSSDVEEAAGGGLSGERPPR